MHNPWLGFQRQKSGQSSLIEVVQLWVGLNVGNDEGWVIVGEFDGSGGMIVPQKDIVRSTTKKHRKLSWRRSMIYNWFSGTVFVNKNHDTCKLSNILRSNYDKDSDRKKWKFRLFELKHCLPMNILKVVIPSTSRRHKKMFLPSPKQVLVLWPNSLRREDFRWYLQTLQCQVIRGILISTTPASQTSEFGKKWGENHHIFWNKK